MKNVQRRTALEMATRTIKDPNVLLTVTKLLTKQSSSVKVVHNREQIEERKARASDKENKMTQIRD